MAGRQGFPWLSYGFTLAVIIVFALSPVILLAFAGPGPDGTPMSLTELMASWGLMGWLLMAPFALGGMAFLVWALALLIHLLVHNRRDGAKRP
jgi:heme exporter protein D